MSPRCVMPRGVPGLMLGRAEQSGGALPARRWAASLTVLAGGPHSSGRAASHPALRQELFGGTAMEKWHRWQDWANEVSLGFPLRGLGQTLQPTALSAAWPSR